MRTSAIDFHHATSVALIAAVVSLAASAQAAPGTIVAHMGAVRGRPDAGAPVLSYLPQYAAVSISADPVAPGWREVQLADGRIGYVLEAEVITNGSSSPVPPANGSSPPASPIDGARQETLSVAGGFGPAFVGSTSGVAVRAAAVRGHGPQTFSLSFTYVGEACGSLFCGDSLPRRSNKEVSLLYGYRRRAPWLAGWLSVGLSAIWSVQRGSTLLATGGGLFSANSYYNEIDHFTVGGTIEGGGGLSSRYVSFGPTVRATIDAVQSSAAIILDLHVGYLGVP